jgi:uncharacterized protein (TIGR03118 family)
VSVPGGPTGTVYNGTTDFVLKSDGKPAVFLFATEAGTILGWNGGAGTMASQVASKPNAVYKGLARAVAFGKNYLYATDFHHGRVDVLDSNFHYVSLDCDRDERRSFTFEGARRANLVPFNIQNIGGTLYVTFARQDAAKHDEVDGPGLGMVASFTPTGRLIRVFQHGPWLSGPWALAEAPGDFGPFSHSLIVGNFGSGMIVAYNEQTGRLNGWFEDATGKPLLIDGLWGLSFGSDQTSGPATTLYFTAGPNDENNGLFGTLTPTAADLTEGNSN